MRVQAPQRIRARHRPVAADGEVRASAVQRTEREVAPSPLFPYQRVLALQDLLVVPRPQRLQVRGYAELDKPAKIRRIDDVEVRDLMLRAGADRHPRSIPIARDRNGVEALAYRAIPDPVEMYGDALGIKRAHDLCENCGVDDRFPARGWLHVRIGFEESGGAVLADPVLHNLDVAHGEARCTGIP